jgi:hypothetical protein
VAEDAVSYEPVFPLNREINREFRRIRPSVAIFVSDQRADSIVYGRIPCGTEQGIFKCVSGNFFRGTGKFNLQSRSQGGATSLSPHAFKGILRVDDYAGFERLTAGGDIVLAACRAQYPVTAPRGGDATSQPSKRASRRVNGSSRRSITCRVGIGDTYIAAKWNDHATSRARLPRWPRRMSSVRELRRPTDQVIY